MYFYKIQEMAEQNRFSDFLFDPINNIWQPFERKNWVWRFHRFRIDIAAISLGYSYPTQHSSFLLPLLAPWRRLRRNCRRDLCLILIQNGVHGITRFYFDLHYIAFFLLKLLLRVQILPRQFEISKAENQKRREKSWHPI